MTPVFRPLMAVSLCTMLSGCFFPTPLMLAIKPVSFLVNRYVSQEETKPKGPISVEELLAQARGEKYMPIVSQSLQVPSVGKEPSPKPNAANVSDEDRAPAATAPISVDELLRQARSKASQAVSSDKRDASPTGKSQGAS